MPTWKLIALGILGGLAAMLAASWHLGVTGGPLIARAGPLGVPVALVATVAAMLIVALWRSREPVVPARASDHEPEASAEEIELQLLRQASHAERLRRSAEHQAEARFGGKSGF